MTLAEWLNGHIYLQPLARFRAQVDGAAAALDTTVPTIPIWDDYAGDFMAGVPLLQSLDAAIDFEPAGRTVGQLIERLASDHPDGTLAGELRMLTAELQLSPDARRVVDRLLGDDAVTVSAPGLFRCVGWTALALYLRPVVGAFANWRDESRWLRRYCPTCGSLPAMAQLVGVDPGRRRFLSCGCCGTRWRYGRTLCPFCEADSHRLTVLAIEGEGGLRIDYCESCRGYLKTYVGEGNETVLLADWTSIHLDLLALDRGLKRHAVSLYELEPALQR